MESLGETLSMFTDNQLQFLNNLEQLVIDSHFAKQTQSNLNENDALWLPYLTNNRESLEQHFQQLSLQHLDQNEQRTQLLLEQQTQCSTLLSSVDRVLNELEKLKLQYQNAISKSGQVQTQCDLIAKQQQDLLQAVNTLESNLTPFRKFDRLNASLLQPLDRLVQSGQLSLLLEETDECIGFFQTHFDFVQAEEYKEKFIELQNQTLLALKNEVLLQLQLQAAKIVPQASEQLAPGENVFTLFYAKFQTFAQRLKPLLMNLERRKHLDETSQSYLTECYQAYVNSREALILPVLSMAVNEMVASNTGGTLQSIRNSSRMVFQMCRDELQLYFNFFERSSSQLCMLIENLCSILYDLLRPLVIKCTHLETLAEIGNILKVEIIEEEVVAAHSELLAFVKIVDLLVQDVQERLIFRANVFIQKEILGYIPVFGDLAYPDKLKMMHTNEQDRLEDRHRSYAPSVGGLSRTGSVASFTSMMSTNTFSDVTLMPFDMSDRYTGGANDGIGYHLWYPTVRRAIMCLTKLFRTLDNSIFQSLAQDVIVACIQTLDSASLQIKTRTSSLDANLFLIKHLLIIREQIAPFKIECTMREVSLDFSKVKDAAMSLLHKGNTIFQLSTNNGLLSFLFEMQSTAQIVDQVLDSQKTVDTRIRITCQTLINECGNQLIEQVEKLRNHLPDIEKPAIAQVKEASDDKQNDEDKQSETNNSGSLIQTKIDLLLQDLCLKVNQIRSLMTLYLANEETEFILFKPIKSRLLKSLETLEKQLRLVFTEEQLNGVQLNASSWIKVATQYSTS